MSENFNLESESLKVEVTQRGAAVLRLGLKRAGKLLSLSRGVDDQPRSGRKGAICPMPWYLGRIENKRLKLRNGEFVEIKHEEDHALHARTPHLDWAVEATSPNSVELVIGEQQLSQFNDAVSYSSKLHYSLRGNTLRMQMDIKALNNQGRFIPGFHPYFLKSLLGSDDNFLFNGFVTKRYEKTEGETFPRQWSTELSGHDFVNSLSPLGVGLDHTHDGWNGIASIYYPRSRVMIQIYSYTNSAGVLPRLHLWHPADGEVWGAEPVLGVPGAWDLDSPAGEQSAVLELQPNQEISFSMELRIFDTYSA